jgi:GNAT superfamily N-acetyltransferase
MLTTEIREYAETPDRFAPIPDGSSVTRYDDGRVCFLQGADWGSVSAVSVAAGEVEALVEQVRGLARQRNYVWWIGPSTRPADLVERLRSLGFGEPTDRVGLLRALVLTSEPAVTSRNIEVRRIATYEDFEAARRLQWEVFEIPPERQEGARARMREDFEEMTAAGFPVWFLAKLDGRPGATAMAVPSERGVFLIAGATAPWARGHGLYRALVRARWEYAVERGTPAVVTQADPTTSYPILKRLGFEDVCTIHRLEDPNR